MLLRPPSAAIMARAALASEAAVWTIGGPPASAAAATAWDGRAEAAGVAAGLAPLFASLTGLRAALSRPGIADVAPQVLGLLLASSMRAIVRVDATTAAAALAVMPLLVPRATARTDGSRDVAADGARARVAGLFSELERSFANARTRSGPRAGLRAAPLPGPAPASVAPLAPLTSQWLLDAAARLRAAAETMAPAVTGGGAALPLSASLRRMGGSTRALDSGDGGATAVAGGAAPTATSTAARPLRAVASATILSVRAPLSSVQRAAAATRAVGKWQRRAIPAVGRGGETRGAGEPGEGDGPR
jgi:hypothetical protein